MGRNWAICIGINQYDNLKPLRYAKRDAEAMRDFFLHEIGFEKIYYFSDDSPPIESDYGPPMRSQPSYGVLTRFLRVRFEQPFLSAGDNLWFFFAGHGRRYRDRDYLMPLDADPGNVERLAIPIRDVADQLRRSGANVILLLDACRNEGDRDGIGIGTEVQQGVVTVFSCSPNEPSYEIDELQQGSFTHALLQGLRIHGEGNCATVERLDLHLRHRVPELNQRYGKPRQTPYTIPEPMSKRHLILLPKLATPSDVITLKNDALEAETEGHLEEAENLWIRVLAVSPADLQAIRAIKRLARLSVSQPPVVVPPPPASTSRDSSAPKVITPTFEFEVVTVNAQGKIIERQKKRAEHHVEQLGGGIGLAMVSIPGGTFQMGAPKGEKSSDDKERPQHTVTVQPFWMSKYPITQAQWRTVAALPKVNRDLKFEPSKFKGAQHPVEQVSWYEAVEFCDRLSLHTQRQYRLPSEAEWEYACRAGTTTPFYFGETITTELANYRGTDSIYENSIYPGSYAQGPKGINREKTTEVGEFPPNAFGLYDMHGNVREWCLDHWHDSYEGAPKDSSEWLSSNDFGFRIIRGGSWFDLPRNCRSASRDLDSLDFTFYDIGFRVVCLAPRTLA